MWLGGYPETPECSPGCRTFQERDCRSDAMQNIDHFTKELAYCPSTGIFEWLRTGGKRAVFGQAGCVTKYGYVQINFRGKSYPAHRLAWLFTYGEWPEYIDHINHVRTDNRINNLRSVTPMESSRNLLLLKRNKLGVTGVCWRNRDKCWAAYIYVKGECIFLGSGLDLFELVCRRKSAEICLGFHPNHGS